MRHLYLLTLATFLAAFCACAQDSAIAPAPDAALASTVPSLLQTAYVPMSAHERWHGYLHENLLSTRFAVEVLGSAFVSGIGHNPQDWGVGARGYFRRVKSRFLTASVDGAVHSSLGAVLHQDTRYWRNESTGGGWRRIGRALARTVVTNNDAGEKVFDVSGLAGIYSGTMLAEYWGPHCCDVWGRGFRAGNSAVIAQAGANLVKEFSPELKHLLKRK